jgi:hypothetical protein
MESEFANVKGMFKINTDIVNRAIAGVAADDWFRKPGDESNHLMFVIGHLIVHRGRTLKVLGGEWDSPWAPLFARGAQRVHDAEYPSAEEMRNAWNQVSADLAAALSNAPTEELSNGTVAFYAFHDAYHAGQVSFLRKWLGYGQTVG